MALNTYTRYAPNVVAPDANYPYGSIKDETVPGAFDGTPLTADWGNDIEGFKQAVLSEAGITPSGDPDTGSDSQILDGLKTLLIPKNELAGDGGSDLVGWKQLGTSSVATTVQDVLYRQAVSMLDYYATGDGADYYPALTRAIAAIGSGLTKSRVLLIPHTDTYWPISQTVLFNVSNFTLLLYGNVKLSSTTRQKTFLFAYDTNTIPAQVLTNINVIGNGSYIDGNGSAMTFTYTHGDGSPNDAAIDFNRTCGVYVENIHATNGAIDSCAIHRSQKWLFLNCEFSYSKEDNGFSVTTDYDNENWVRGDFNTYGYGSCINCVAHNNRDLGMTAYNCSGVKFSKCVSFENSGGYSYEDAFGAPDAKVYDGVFEGCIAYNNIADGVNTFGGCGWYVDASGIKIDDSCKSFGNSFNGTDVDGLYGHGVLLSTTNLTYVGGEHTYNQKAGVAIFNGATMTMNITIGAACRSNGWHGLHARGVNELIITDKAQFKDNGLTLVNGVYGKGINISNSGATYLQGLGSVHINGAVISSNGAGAIRCDYVKEVNITNIFGTDNLVQQSGYGVDVHNATDVFLTNNVMLAGITAQTIAFVIEASVLNGYDCGNHGSGSTGVSSNLATTSARYIRDQYIGSTTYDAPSLADGAGVTTTVPVIGATLGDFAVVSLNVDTQGLTITAWVSSNNVVSVRLQNETGTTIDLASTTLRAAVFRRNA